MNLRINSKRSLKTILLAKKIKSKQTIISASAQEEIKVKKRREAVPFELHWHAQRSATW